MSSVFETLQLLSRPLLIAKAGRKIRIDEWTFRLHYRTTSTLLFLFSGLLCLREYLGDHITCVQTDEDLDYTDVPKNVLDSYCFIKSTFTVPYIPTTVPRQFRLNRPMSVLLGGPGYIPGKTEKVYHAYYQWTPFFLFFQAVLFYLPHAFWKMSESDRIKNLVQDLNVLCMNFGRALLKKPTNLRSYTHERYMKGPFDFLCDCATRPDKVKEYHFPLRRFPLERIEKCSHTTAVTRYLVKSKGQHVFWATKYVLAELGNLVVVLGSMYLTDVFLNYEFSSYGPKVLSLVDTDHNLRDDPMTKVFPRMTKCNINRYGPSGGIQRFEALCVLSSNIMNEKIFTFLWFWYVLLAVITIIAVIYRGATLVSFGLRLNALGSARDFPEKPQGKYILTKFGWSDWLLLRFLRLNMDSLTFYKLVRGIHEEIMGK